MILDLQGSYLDQIVDGTSTYGFQKYPLQPTVTMIWFIGPSITRVCEVLPARIHNEGDMRPEEDGTGNAEFNARHEDWKAYDYACVIVSVYELPKA